MSENLGDFILLLILGTCWCWGVFTLFHEGYILERLGNKFRKYKHWAGPKCLQEGYKGTWYSKPLFDCPPCMASVHGFLVSAIYYEFHIYPMLAYMICLCGLNFVIKSILYPEYE